MKKLIRTVVVVAVTAWALAPNTGQATLIPLGVAMDGAQANAGVGTGSPGTGTATVTLDDATFVLSWSITWSGLIGTPTAMHFHGPALPNQNAGVQVGTGVVGPPVFGNAVISASQEADLLAGLWYLNLHTTAFPGGEIRGQVLSQTSSVPEPSTLAIFAIALAGLGFMMRRRRVV